MPRNPWTSTDALDVSVEVAQYGIQGEEGLILKDRAAHFVIVGDRYEIVSCREHFALLLKLARHARAPPPGGSEAPAPVAVTSVKCPESGRKRTPGHRGT